ncbi:Uncharacterized protein dnm_077520 [Desulfonema magnum]|uniref:Uncharacterized protein n=1 Tax=Desulfonema magnum TaxID=45655 RepID=A0A975GS56_9BACT|nr:Uncharacterized protein dnm_077520 [Desulfonema magnum]
MKKIIFFKQFLCFSMIINLKQITFQLPAGQFVIPAKAGMTNFLFESDQKNLIIE